MYWVEIWNEFMGIQKLHKGRWTPVQKLKEKQLALNLAHKLAIMGDHTRVVEEMRSYDQTMIKHRLIRAFYFLDVGE